jgi:hypothetical protein
LQTDRVQHPGGGFAKPWCRGAFDGLAGKALDDKAGKTIQVDQVSKLDPVPEGAAGGKNGIPQAQGANLYAEIDSVCGTHCPKRLPRSGSQPR